MRFDGERFVQELFIKLLLRGKTQDDRFAAIVDQRTVGASDHLEDIGDRVVHVRVNLSLVEQCVHDDDELRMRANRPTQIT